MRLNNSNVDFSSLNSSISSYISSQTDLEKVIYRSDVNNLKVYYINADFLLNTLNELQVQINLLNPDIIVVTEVFPKTECFKSPQKMNTISMDIQTSLEELMQTSDILLYTCM